MKHRPIITLLVLACAAAIPAAAQGLSPGPLRAQVDAMTRRMPSGIRLLREPWMGALPQDSIADVWVRLRAGVRYQLMPVCDEDCADMDLRLYDATGIELAHASDIDDIPLLSITPVRTGRYRMRITMLSCAAASCGWAAAMYGRDGGGG